MRRKLITWKSRNRVEMPPTSLDMTMLVFKLDPIHHVNQESKHQNRLVLEYRAAQGTRTNSDDESPKKRDIHYSNRTTTKQFSKIAPHQNRKISHQSVREPSGAWIAVVANITVLPYLKKMRPSIVSFSTTVMNMVACISSVDTFHSGCWASNDAILTRSWRWSEWNRDFGGWRN